MGRMRWYQAGCFSLALALSMGIGSVLDLTPEGFGYWLLLYSVSLTVVLLTVIVYQRVEEDRVDWFATAHGVLVLARYCAAVLMLAFPVFLVQVFFPSSWLETLYLALALGLALTVGVILVLAGVMSSIEHRSFRDVLLNARRNVQG